MKWRGKRRRREGGGGEWREGLKEGQERDENVWDDFNQNCASDSHNTPNIAINGTYSVANMILTTQATI